MWRRLTPARYKRNQTRMRNTASCAVLAIAALAVASCSSASTSSSFKPGGSLVPTNGSTTAAPTTSATKEFGFAFPAGYTVQFSAPATSARNRAVIDALEKQQAGFRYALYVNHGNSRYLRWTAAPAAPSFQQVVQMARTRQWAEKGTVQYTNIKVTSAIYTFPSGSGTSGTFCVVASGVRDYSTHTGKAVSPIMPTGSYLFSMHKDPHGVWMVAGVQKGGASSCGS